VRRVSNPGRPTPRWGATISWQNWLFGAAVVALMTFTLFPFYWAIVASLTPEAALFRDPSLWPTHIILDHYRALFDERDFITPIRNSLVVAGTTTVFCLIVGTLAAYALARLEFKGKAAIMAFILAVTMFPQISIVSPLYLLLRSLHLIDTYPGLIMPYMTFAMPLTVWVLTGSIRQIPKDLEEAASLDGATRWQRFSQVTIPMIMPTILLCTVLSTLSAMKVLEEVLIMTKGGPVSSTYTGLYYAYDQGIRAFNFPRALAASLVVSAFCVVIAWLNFRVLRPRHR